MYNICARINFTSVAYVFGQKLQTQDKQHKHVHNQKKKTNLKLHELNQSSLFPNVPCFFKFVSCILANDRVITALPPKCSLYYHQ